MRQPTSIWLDEIHEEGRGHVAHYGRIPLVIFLWASRLLHTIH